MQTKRDRHQALIRDRKAAQDKLEALRNEQSAALINGTNFTKGGDIRALSDEIDALDAAITVADAHAGDEEAREAAARRATTRQREHDKFEQNTVTHLDAVRRFEEHILAAVDDLGEIHKNAAEAEAFALAVSGERAVPAFARQNIEARLSLMLCRAFARWDIAGFGSIRWAPEHPHEPDAVAEERRQLAGIMQLVKKRCDEYVAEQTALAAE